MKKCAILTFGCKVNQHETQGIFEACEREGLAMVAQHAKPDVFIINTCSVTEKAENEALRTIRRIQKNCPSSEIIVTGCVVDKKLKKIAGASILVPSRQKHLIPRLASDPASQLRFRPCFQDDPKNLPISRFAGHTRAFIKVQDGCSYNCSFCKIAQARGKSVSRPTKEIIEEAKRLISNGYKELVITGVCVGAYGRELQEKKDLSDIIDAISKLKNIGRIRISSIELSDISDRLVSMIAKNKNICRHLHIPLQSGSDRILSLMRRRYTTEEFLEKIGLVRRDLPGLQISTDIIAGFPSESEEDASLTEEALRKLKPIRSHFFPFSPRPHTLAAKINEKVPPSTMRARINRLKDIQARITEDILGSFIGRELSVLVENSPNKKIGVFEGYSDAYVKCFFEGSRIRTNAFVRIKVTSASGSCVFGASCR